MSTLAGPLGRERGCGWRMSVPEPCRQLSAALLFHQGGQAPKSCRLRRPRVSGARDRSKRSALMRLPEFMQEIARRCRFRSRETFDLAAAGDSIGLHRPPVGTFVPGIVSRGGSVVGGRADCDGGGRRLVGSIAGSTGVKNASPWADLPPKAMSPFAVETRSPGRNVGSFFTPRGARPKGSLPLQVQFATSSFR